MRRPAAELLLQGERRQAGADDGDGFQDFSGVVHAFGEDAPCHGDEEDVSEDGLAEHQE